MLQKLANEAATSQDALAKVVIQKDSAADFIEQFESAGKRIQVVVAVDSVEPRAGSTPDLEELRVVLHATGSWEEAARFVALVETLPLESRVLSAAFSRTGALGEAFWRADLVLTALKEK
jgi:D-serine deaminase-like pyridoxal phosphate-dependent protein